MTTQPRVTIKTGEEGKEVLAWRCKCDTWNYWTRTTCYKCGVSRETAISQGGEENE